MISPPSRPLPGGRSDPGGRRLVLTLAILGALIGAMLTWALWPDESVGPEARGVVSAKPTARPPAAPTPPDPLQPPVYQLQVNACATNDAPVELFGFDGAIGWDGRAPTTRVASCDPDPTGRCTFADLAPRAWVVRQGPTARKYFIQPDPTDPSAEVDLPCAGTCAVDLVVEADPDCGDTGTLTLLPPVPLPPDETLDPQPAVTWTSGQTQRIDQFTCTAAAVELKTSNCRQIRTVSDPEGAPLRALRLKLEALERIELRFVDSETGAPIPGVSIEDTDYWTMHVSNKNGSVRIIKQPREKSTTAVLSAHHPDYQSTGVYPPRMENDPELVPMQRRQELRVDCVVDGAPCPGRTIIVPRFFTGPPPEQPDYKYGEGGEVVQGACTWDSPGTWRCERGRDSSVFVNIDGRGEEFSAPDGAPELAVHISTKAPRACIRATWPSGDCMLELAGAVAPVRRPTEFVPLPEGEGPVAGRVVCQEAVTWAELQLDRGGACTSPGPWAELAGICARSPPGPAVEDQAVGACMILDAASAMGLEGGISSSSPPVLERCPSWFPPGDYFVACGEGIAQPVTLVAGEVLEWRPPAP
jgi:hypothetical protein